MHHAVAASRLSAGLLDAYRCGSPWSEARRMGIKRRLDGAYVRCYVQVRVNGKIIDCDVEHLGALCLDDGLCKRFEATLGEDATDVNVVARVRRLARDGLTLCVELDGDDEAATALAHGLRPARKWVDRVFQMHAAFDAHLHATLSATTACNHAVLPLHVANDCRTNLARWHRLCESCYFHTMLIRDDGVRGPFRAAIPVVDCAPNGDAPAIVACVTFDVRWDRKIQYYMRSMTCTLRGHSPAARGVGEALCENIRRLLGAHRGSDKTKYEEDVRDACEHNGYAWYHRLVTTHISNAVGEFSAATNANKLIQAAMDERTLLHFKSHARVDPRGVFLHPRQKRDDCGNQNLLGPQAPFFLDDTALYCGYSKMLRDRFGPVDANNCSDDHSPADDGAITTSAVRAVRVVDDGEDAVTVYYGHVETRKPSVFTRARQPTSVLMQVSGVVTERGHAHTDDALIGNVSKQIPSTVWHARVARTSKEALRDTDRDCACLTVYDPEPGHARDDLRSARGDRMVWYTATHDPPRLRVSLAHTAATNSVADSAQLRTMQRLREEGVWRDATLIHARRWQPGGRPGVAGMNLRDRRPSLGKSASKCRTHPGDVTSHEAQTRAFELLEHSRLDLATVVFSNVFGVPVLLVGAAMTTAEQALIAHERRVRWPENDRGIVLRLMGCEGAIKAWHIAVCEITHARPKLHNDVVIATNHPQHAYESMHESLYHAVRLSVRRWPTVCVHPPDPLHLTSAHEVERVADYDQLRADNDKAVPPTRLRVYKEGCLPNHVAADNIWVYARACVYPARLGMTELVRATRGRQGILRFANFGVEWDCATRERAPIVQIAPVDEEGAHIPGLRVWVNKIPHDIGRAEQGYDIQSNLARGRITVHQGQLRLTTVTFDALVTIKCEVETITVHLLLVP